MEKPPVRGFSIYFSAATMEFVLGSEPKLKLYEAEWLAALRAGA